MQDRHPAAKKVIIQSDNASGFASQDLVPFIFSINTSLDDENNVVLIIWVFTEAQTGKTRLDTHYSFLNKKNQAYVEDDNEILIEDYIVKAISFNGGISSITALIVDAVNLFGKRALKKNKFKVRTGARETHGICQRKYLAEVTKSSNVSVTEIIPLTKLQKYANNYIFVNIVSRIKSVKSEIWLKEGGYVESSVAPTNDISNKTVCYLAAL